MELLALRRCPRFPHLLAVLSASVLLVACSSDDGGGPPVFSGITINLNNNYSGAPIVLATEEDDTITFAGTTTTPDITDIASGGGNDTYTHTAGVLGADGNPVDIWLGAGGDTLTLEDGTLYANIYGGPGGDRINLTGGELRGNIYLGNGERLENSPYIRNEVFLGEVDDEGARSGAARLYGNIIGGADEDFVALYFDGRPLEDAEGDPPVAETPVSFAIDLRGGNDEIHISAGFSGDYDGGRAPDTLTATNFYGGTGVDTLTLDGGKLTTITGDSDEGDILRLRAGMVGKDITGVITGELTLAGGDNQIEIGYIDTKDDDDSGNDTYEGTVSIVVGITLGDGEDSVVIYDFTRFQGGIDFGGGDDTLELYRDYTIATHGALEGGEGDDTFTLNEGDFTGDLMGSADVDTFTINDDGTLTGNFVASDDGDNFTLDGGKMTGNIQGDDGEDTITLQNGVEDDDETPSIYEGSFNPLAHYINTGAGADTIIIGSNYTFITYNGGASGTTAGVIYGGEGGDTLTIDGGTISGNITGEDGMTAGMDEDDNPNTDDTIIYTSGIIEGDIALDGGNDELTLSPETPDIRGGIDMGAGEDRIEMQDGCYPAYQGGAVGTGGVTESEVDCNDDGDSDTDDDSQNITRPVLYGGAGGDVFVMQGGVIIGSITGDDGTSAGVDADGNDNTDDTITYSGGTIRGGISLGAGNDELTLSASTPDIGGVVDVGAGDDVIIVEGGCYPGYSAAAQASNPAQENVACGTDEDEDDEPDLIDRPIIYGGAGADTFTLNGTELTGSITGDDEADSITLNDAKIGGDIILADGADTLTFTSTTSNIEGYVDLGAGDDTLVIEVGCYAAYNAIAKTSTDAEQSTVDCDGDGDIDITTDPDTEEESDIMRPLLYGGTGATTLTLDGGRISGGITGNDEADVVNIHSGRVIGDIMLNGGADEFTLGKEDEDETPEITASVDMGAGRDTVTLYGGTLDFVRTGTASENDNDTIKLLGEVTFNGDCDDETEGDQWICGGGGGADSITYGTDIDELLRGDNLPLGKDVERSCVIEAGEEDCTLANIVDPEPESTLASHISGVERVALTPELELWSGLAPAMQSLATELIQPFGEASTSQSGAMAHLFGGEVKQRGLAQTRQSHLRQRNHNRISLGTISGHTLHTQDMTLSQQRITSALTQDWSLGGGLSVAEGTITTNGVGMDVMAYVAEAGLSYTGGGFIARAGALGTLFEFAPRNHKGLGEITTHQVSVVASLARKFQIGGLVIMPAAKLVWHKSDIALTATTPELFTAEAGAELVYAGQHFHARFSHSEGEAGQLGAVRHHAGGERTEFGWQSVFTPAKGTALTGAVKWQYAPTTGIEEVQGGIWLKKEF